MGDFGHQFVCRVRFSVRAQRQNASFRRMHFSSPGQTWRRLTKKRTLRLHLTKKRTLYASSHQKAQSAVRRLGRMRFSVSPNSNRDLRTLAQPAPQAGGGLLERICPVGPFFIVPRSLAGGCPTPPGCRNVTEKRILRRRPHAKVHSEPAASRKSTFWRWPLTEKCTLCGRRDGRGTLSVGPHAKAHSACGQPPRVRFSVRVCSQSALFRRMRLFSPGQTSSRLTQKRILCR